MDGLWYLGRIFHLPTTFGWLQDQSMADVVLKDAQLHKYPAPTLHASDICYAKEPFGKSYHAYERKMLYK